MSRFRRATFATGQAAPPPFTDWFNYPFARTDVANRPIPATATFEPDGGTMTTTLQAEGGSAVNSTNWSFAFYQAADTDPIATVTDPTTGAVRATIPIPVGAVTTGGTDKHMGVVLPDGYTAHEFYKMTQVSATAWTSPYHVTNDLRSTGLNKGVRASGTSIFWGPLRKPELAANLIEHTLVMAIPATALQDPQVWPARLEDNAGPTTYTGTIPMGSLFAIPPTVNLTALGLTARGLAVARALQDYGAYVMLQAATVALYAELGTPTAQVTELVNAWSTVRPLLRAVTNNGP